MSLWYFSGCFPLAFLGGCCFSLSLKLISLHLDPVIWDPSAPSKRAASFASTLFQSCQMYSNCFFFFSSSASLYFFSFLPYLNLCLSPCFLSYMFYTIGLHCFFQTNQEPLLFLILLLYLIALFFKHINIMLRNIREGRGRYKDTEEKAKKLFLSVYILLTWAPSWDSSDKLNRTSKAQS